MVNPIGKGSIGSVYNWVGSGQHLSNMYYKILANRPTYDIGGRTGMDMVSEAPSGHNLHPYSIGDENGNPVAMWGLRVSCMDCWNTTQLWAGGPCMWRPTMPKNPTRAKAAKDNSTMLIRNESNQANRQTIFHQSKDKSSSSQDL